MHDKIVNAEKNYKDVFKTGSIRIKFIGFFYKKKVNRGKCYETKPDWENCYFYQTVGKGEIIKNTEERKFYNGETVK